MVGEDFTRDLSVNCYKRNKSLANYQIPLAHAPYAGANYRSNQPLPLSLRLRGGTARRWGGEEPPRRHERQVLNHAESILRFWGRNSAITSVILAHKVAEGSSSAARVACASKGVVDDIHIGSFESFADRRANELSIATNVLAAEGMILRLARLLSVFIVYGS